MKHIKLFEAFNAQEHQGDVAAMSIHLDPSRIFKPDGDRFDRKSDPANFGWGDLYFTYYPSIENHPEIDPPYYVHKVCKDLQCVSEKFFEDGDDEFIYLDKSIDPNEVVEDIESRMPTYPNEAMSVIEELAIMGETPYTDEFLSHCRYLIFYWSEKDPHFKRQLESIPAKYLEGPRKPMEFKVNLKIEK